MKTWSIGLPAAALALVAIADLLQKKHSLLRNFPVLGHGRYLLEAVGPGHSGPRRSSTPRP